MTLQYDSKQILQFDEDYLRPEKLVKHSAVPVNVNQSVDLC